MKSLSIKALFISAFAVLSLNAQAADSTYNLCVSDAENLISTAKAKGIKEAKALEQKTTLAQCYEELNAIEAKYGDATKGVNPSAVMTPEDRAKWAKLFDSIDAKQFKGVPFLQASYYR
ncbi:hypothetical protein [Thiosulfativibrio zosterae]|uniref:Lysozyme inhibitor LprI N-terminal domain-containing protein n=1 Tax=Thiosulfativibrio zosterae TaxID=2675053 RepID=A0A6F8PP56_9GAMM|nr:hypothetical protein [Thiosulfativibrio zosterae]BBP43856.1 hypothetical protein THMIRHAT_16020 [Thiosulfativibrio zosterae]